MARGKNASSKSVQHFNTTQYYAYQRLICCLAQNRLFSSKVDAIRKDFPDVHQWPSFGFIWAGEYDMPPETRSKYINRLQELADRFNLHVKDPHWVCPNFPILNALHNYISSSKNMNSCEWQPEGEPIGLITLTCGYGVKLPIHIFPNTRLDQVIGAVKSYWEIYVKRQEGYQEGKFPHRLESHIDWLYQSVVLGKTSLKIYDDLSKSERDEDWRTPETIKGAINRLAKMLDIPLRRGRSSKRSKKV